LDNIFAMTVMFDTIIFIKSFSFASIKIMFLIKIVVLAGRVLMYAYSRNERNIRVKIRASIFEFQV
jgi:hypothetical protein